MRYAVQVQSADGTEVLQSERQTLDAATVGLWLSTQTLEAAAGVKLVILALGDSDPLPAGWPSPVTLGGSDYTLPEAAAGVLGGIKVGTGLLIASDGTLSVSAAYITSIAGSGGGGGTTGGGTTSGGTGIIEDTDSGVTAAGWTQVIDSECHGGTCLKNNLLTGAGNALTFNFTGERIRVYGAPRALVYHCLVDGADNVGSQGSPTTDYNPVLLFDSGSITGGSHTFAMYAGSAGDELFFDYAQIG